MSTPVKTPNKLCLCRHDSSSSGGITSQLKSSRKNTPSSRAYEDILVEATNHLSFDEIQHEQELLHGVADEVDRNEKTINDLLLGLEFHLNRMKKGTTYELAEKQDPSYVSNRELQLAFLRASRFEPKASAEKLIRFFKYKQDLFGEESLVRDITAQDLDQDERSSLESRRLSYMFQQPIRIHECQYLLTSYGITRGALPLNGPESEIDFSAHSAWFQRRVLREKEQRQQVPVRIPFSNVSIAQKRSVLCHDTVSAPNSGNENDVLSLGQRVKGLGNERLHSLALIYSKAYANADISNRRTIVAWIIDEVHRHGGRFLKPDPQGSKADSMLSKDEGKIIWVELSSEEQRAKITQLFRNLRRRRSITSTISRPPVHVEQIGQHDVLFGPQSDNPGNRRLRELVVGLLEKYDRTDRGEKKNTVSQLIERIRHKGGRFLKPSIDGTRWEVVSDEAAREKVSKQFRNIRRALVRRGCDEKAGHS
ncbi:unnamed protein product [Cylindrotheca closterium]|uniref:DUF6824 domain-containing protein n=1 Tax=Cylindrotheca closterium TaxID=2856 RepID=A0AAD2PWW6_9STRA|nr:unnamed protein product [Cylindrotheca closterium]